MLRRGGTEQIEIGGFGAEGKIPNNDLFISFTVQNKTHNRINKNIFIGINIKMLTLGSKLKLSLSLASWGIQLTLARDREIE